MRAFAAIVGAGVLGLSTAAAAQGPVVAIPAPVTDEGLRYTPSDREGRYVFRPAPGAEAVSLDGEAFVAWMREQQSDRTIRDRQGRHGWLAEYSTADGRTFLWYPGNRRVVKGRWKVELTPARLNGKPLAVARICFQYPGTSNPVEGKRGDAWDCWPAYNEVSDPERRAAAGREVRAGDVFNLTSGKIPHVLTRETRPEWPTEAPR